MSILNQYRQKRVVVSTEDDDTSTTGVVETPEVVINVENVEKLEVEATPDIEDAELVGEEKAEMVSSLENHIEETIEQVEEAEQAAEVLEEQADIMENLANSGDATPGAVQAAVSSAGLLINQLGVDIEEENADAPSAVETIVVSQESIAQDHVQALVVSMEGVKELAGNLASSARDTTQTVIRGLSTLFKSRWSVAKALSDRVSKEALDEKVKRSFGDADSRSFDGITFHDLLMTQGNDGQNTLKNNWATTTASSEKVVKGVEKVIATYNKELAIWKDVDFNSPEAVAKAVAQVSKLNTEYGAPFKAEDGKFDDLGCSGLLAMKIEPNEKAIGKLTDTDAVLVRQLVSLEFAKRGRYKLDAKKPGIINGVLHFGFSGYVARELAKSGFTYFLGGNLVKSGAMATGAATFGIASLIWGLITIVRTVKQAVKFTVTPSISFSKKDIDSAVSYLAKAPALIKSLEEVFDKAAFAMDDLSYEIYSTKIVPAKNGKNLSKEVTNAISKRMDVIENYIFDLIRNEINYINFVQKRTYNFLNVFAAGSRQAAKAE